ncbi:MAG: hypothetical protein H6727_06425 [Myxococcales bacterium]|nr:hypothetical protein [Myxococcales bacterium]
MKRSYAIIWLGLSALFFGVMPQAQAQELGFLERFATAPDRKIPLKQLIPGTRDAYYYTSLHLQHQGKLQEVDALLVRWRKRFPYDSRKVEIEHRQALLRYATQPQKALKYLRRHLGVSFYHRRRVRGEKPKLPTTLDANKLSRETLYQKAMQRYNPLSQFSGDALEWLLQMPISHSLQSEVISRLERPDVPGLPAMIVRDIKDNESISFGSRTIHSKLLLEQLQACLKLMPSLRNDGSFVRVYLERLQPAAGVDLENDLSAREAHFKRLWAFVSKLGSVHRSLKVHILYHWLALDEQRGMYSRSRFMRYLRYPRQVFYTPRSFRKRYNYASRASLSEDFSSISGRRTIGSDWALVQRYLRHFFLADKSYKSFSSLVNKSYLKRLFAETKLLAGIGSAEKWVAMIPASRYQNLRERVELTFARTNPNYFGIAQDVKLDLFIKNVKKLIVKVYRINAESYYRQHKREVTTALNLDGLVANSEKIYTYDHAPIRRVRHTFNFPHLKARGVYIIDFIGNGKSSRALVRKGKLFFLERLSIAGHIFTILDEQGKPAPSPSIWMDGREFTADKHGKITIPYTNKRGKSKVLLVSGDFVSLASFSHRSESYKLKVGFTLDRESLIAGKKATLLMRPSLSIHGQRAPLKLLKEVTLEITSTDRFGVSSSRKVEDLKLKEGREFVYTFRTPEQLSSLLFKLTAKVTNVSQGKDNSLQETHTVYVNGIDKSSQLHAMHLIHAGNQYAVALLDRTGRAIPDHVIRLTMKHRMFSSSITERLRTDNKGRVNLGELKEIETLSVHSRGASRRRWTLKKDTTSLPQTIHARAGETISIPVNPGVSLSREHISFIETVHGANLHDHFEKLRLEKGFLVMEDLKDGEYKLHLKDTDQTIYITLAKGTLREGYLVSEQRFLQHNYIQPVQVTAQTDAKNLTLQLSNVGPNTRLHLFATHFWPDFNNFVQLYQARPDGVRSMTLAQPKSDYATGRNIGDEYRYILDRKYAKKYPGNMLRRPGLLLNPWAVRKTSTEIQLGATGEGFGGFGRGGGGWGHGAGRGDLRGRGYAGISPNLDFLAHPSVLLANLRPNKQGQIVIPRSKLKHHHLLRVLVFDGNQGLQRMLSLPEAATKYRDLRLIVSLPAKAHYTQQKQVAAVQKGGKFKLADITSSEMERLDSLERVFLLLQTLCSDALLKDFAGLMGWPKMNEKQKLAFYGKHASHELNFFLYRHDNAFFNKVIKPYIANKYEKTFLDRWLLGQDVTSYIKPWAYAQLNVFERILLAQNIKGELPLTAQHLADKLALRPMDPQTWSRLFDAVLRLRALDQSDDTGLRDAKDKLLEDGKRLALKESSIRPLEDAPSPSAAPAPPAAKSYDGLFARRRRPSRGRRYFKLRAKRKKNGHAEEKKAEKDEDSRDFERRAQSRSFFRQKEKTQEWAENNYYKRTLAAQNASLIQGNRFWLDLARHSQGPFLSRHIVEATNNATEVLLALAFLDLPWKAGKPKIAYQGTSLTLTAAEAMLIFHKQLRAVQAPKNKSPLLVSQGYFDAARRYRYVGGQRVERYVTEEFLPQKIYGTQVIITNPTAARMKLEVLLQIPQGAMAVSNGRVTHTKLINIGAYQTRRMAYYFYFPAKGRFAHFPVHVSSNGKLMSFAAPGSLKVVEKLSKLDGESWEYISQEAPAKAVLAYIARENLARVNLTDLAWRMKDKSFFAQAIAALSKRHYYDNTLWSYSIRHNDKSTLSEYLKHQDGLLSSSGMFLRSALLDIDPTERKLYEHLEYRPLVNARAHAFGKKRKILNNRFRQQYNTLLRLLTYKPSLDAHDHIALSYYLLLQDRIEEAIQRFALVQPQQLASKLQYDYFHAYLSFFSASTKTARTVATKYKDHPVPRWRKRFREVLAQLDEIEGKTAATTNTPKTVQKDRSPSLAMKLEGRKLALRFANLDKLQIRYYPMDVELLFSRSPFLRQLSGRFTVVKPAATEQRALTVGQRVLMLELPQKFRNSNVMIEVASRGLSRTVVSYANALDVQIFEQEGHLQVTHEIAQKPLARVYVKVYARLKGGKTQFYKDGYTDLRGRFDYASLSTDTLDRVERFSVLILSEKDGASVREIAPPRQ